MVLVEEGEEEKLKHPKGGSFWRAFHDALEKYKPWEWKGER